MNTTSWALWKCLRSCPLRKRQLSGWKLRDSSLKHSVNRKKGLHKNKKLHFCFLFVIEIIVGSRLPVPTQLCLCLLTNPAVLDFVFFLVHSVFTAGEKLNFAEMPHWLLSPKFSIRKHRFATWFSLILKYSIDQKKIPYLRHTCGLNSRRTTYFWFYKCSLVQCAAFPIFNRPLPTISGGLLCFFIWSTNPIMF